MTSSRNALIVGAGIAGCAAAIALAQRGFSVDLIEKQDEWRFQSSGIFVYSNGLASLKALGVLDDILAAGFAINDGQNLYFDHLGTPIVNVYYPTVGSGIPPILGIKRSEIHRALAKALASHTISARLNTTLERLEPGTESSPASADLSDGSQQQYDLVIGADGIRSQVRQIVLPSIQPHKTSFGVWRSIHRRPSQLKEKIMQMGIGKRLGIMPIADELLYIFGTLVEPHDAWYEPSDWPELMQEKFAEFQGPVRPFLDEISAHTEVLFTKVEEIRAPLPWHKGRVLLIGDAAHASTPFMGQGGAMALEDAVILGQLLGQQTDIHSALSAFGKLRLPVCQFVQEASRKVGEAGAEENAASCMQRNENMKNSAQQHVDNFYKKLAELSNQSSLA